MRNAILATLLVTACQGVLAQDDGKGTCPTIHACPPAGVTKEEWSKYEVQGRTIPEKSTWEVESDRRMEEYHKNHTIEPMVGLKISADDLIAHSTWDCDKVNRTIVAAGERDQVVCGWRYVYIDNGVITSIQR